MHILYVIMCRMAAWLVGRTQAQLCLSRVALGQLCQRFYQDQQTTSSYLRLDMMALPSRSMAGVFGLGLVRLGDQGGQVGVLSLLLGQGVRCV